MVYTIGIQMGRLPVFRKFRVVDHVVDGDKVALYDAFGGCTVVPGLDRRALRLYPDYRRVWEQKKRLEHERQLREKFEAFQQQQRAAGVEQPAQLTVDFPVAPVPIPDDYAQH